MPFSLGVWKMSQLKDVDLAGQAQGDILYRDSSQWKKLPAGNSGQKLKSNGPEANPSWSN